MKISQSQPTRIRRDRVGETVILFFVANARFAIAAQAVEEIREADRLQEFHFGSPHEKLAKVRQMFVRQGKTYFVVNGAEQFHLPAGRPDRLLVLRHAPGAVSVDSIERMQEIHAIHELPEAFSGEERNWYRGLTLIKGQVVPVVRAESFLSKSEATLLAASLRSSRRSTGLVTA
jgi:chemotaxis signal transduction protein